MKITITLSAVHASLQQGERITATVETAHDIVGMRSTERTPVCRPYSDAQLTIANAAIEVDGDDMDKLNALAEAMIENLKPYLPIPTP